MHGTDRSLAVPLTLAGMALCAAPAGNQLIAAAAGIGLLGLPHGASDLSCVAPDRRTSFVAAYLLVAAAATGLWFIAPTGGLVLLLALSVVHFATDHADGGDPAAGWARGVLLVAGPALLHRTSLGRLFAELTGSPLPAQALALWLAGLAAAAGLLLLKGVSDKRHHIPPADAVALAALLLLPPLLGFTVGFVALHAWPELAERRREFGCADLGAYLRLTAPVLAGAIALIGVLALLFATQPAGSSRLLFAAITALAIPHMLVTPWWRDRSAPQPLPA